MIKIRIQEFFLFLILLYLCQVKQAFASTIMITTPEQVQKLHLIETQKQLLRLDIKIANSTGDVIFPFTSIQKQQKMRCGAISSLKFKHEQILFVESKEPFLVIVSSKEQQIKMSGFGESIISEETGRHVAMLIVTRMCNSYFSSQKYSTIFQIYKQQNKQILTKNDPPFIFEVPSLTYCLEEVELRSLENSFNIGYTVLWGIVASMLPTFPIQKRYGIIAILFLILVPLLAKDIQNMSIVLLYFPIYLNLMKRYNLEPQHEQVRRLAKNSVISMYLVYLTVKMVIYFTQPNYYQISSKPGIIYVMFLYLKNCLEMLIFIYAYSCIVWINRIRGAVWYLVIVVSLPFIMQKYYPSLFDDYPQFLGLLLPSTFTQSCQYRSLLYIILINPICQYMDRYSKIKFAALLVIISMILFGAFSQKLGILVYLFWIVGWTVIMVMQDGQFVVMTRRWLSISEIRSLTQ